MSENWFKRAIVPNSEAENRRKHTHTPTPANMPTSARSERIRALRPDLAPKHHPNWDWPAIDAAMEAAGWFKIAHNHDGVGGGDGTND